MADYGAVDSLVNVDEPDNAADSAEPDFAPDPWYRNRVLLALWALAVALVLTLIIYGLVELSRGGESGVPATTTPSTTHTRSSTTSPTTNTTNTTTTPSSGSEAPPPPPETPEQTPEEEPPQNTSSPAPTEPPRHHHHHLHLPHGFF
jgi:cytoskeletal protein RodZ